MKSPTNIVLVLLAIALFYAYTSPQYQEVKALRASAGEYQDVLDNVSNIAAARDALLVDYQSIPRNQVERMSKMIPDTVDTVRLALDLDTIASRYGITLKDVKVDTKGDPNSALAVLPNNSVSYEKAMVTFSFISNYDNFIRFLADLERSLRLMDVKSVFFATTEGGLYEHKMVVETYWLKN
jgi:hypothetical protein